MPAELFATAITRYHRELEGLFLAHQEALLDKDLGRAVERLATYRRLLTAHAEEEDRLLFPIYLERITPERGSEVHVFAAEHEKLEALLDDLGRALTEIAASPAARPLNRRLIWLLDREHRFKNVAEHHFHREETRMFPALDEAITPEERDAIFAQLTLAAPR